MKLSITPQELKRRLETHEPITILDIRTPQEVEDFNLGGIFIPLEDLLSRIDELINYQHQEIIVICYAGFQSIAAQAILAKRGFLHVKNLEGGLEEYLCQ